MRMSGAGPEDVVGAIGFNGSVFLDGLDPELAPSWLWMLAALVAVALMLVASRMTQAESE